MPEPNRPEGAREDNPDAPPQPDNAPTDADTDRSPARADGGGGGDDDRVDKRNDKRNDKRGDDDDDEDDVYDLNPFVENLCRVINYRKDGTLRPRFPFTDLPLWLGIAAALTGWNLMSAAEYYGVKNQLMILFGVFLVWILWGKRR